uniref:RNA-binding region-containing protein 3 n=1 Tax=Callorhinchus milii TaxID=7868 RepID=A0A4W3ILH6_CALMI
MAAVINKSKNGRTVIVRHLPAELARNEKEELLQCFGAESVRVFSDRGRMKHTAFATFPSENAAAKALTRLHQLKILGHTLVVEFVKEHVHLPDQPKPIDKKTLKPSGPVIENGIAPKLGLIQPMNPCLKYLYPPPTSVILANIANAMASVPKFYVQVLHLMNKMNLPAPFGPITARPPMYEEYSPAPPPMPPLPPEEPPLPEEEMDVSSEEESEYESGNFCITGITLNKLDILIVRDCLFHSCSIPFSTHSAVPPSEVFEQPQTHSQKKIAFHISADVVVFFRGQLTNAPFLEQENTAEAQSIGFGKIHPTPVYSKIEEDEEEEEEILTEFISRRDLAKGRISKEEIESISVFKKYYPGEPTCRLYVKNLSKQAEEKDLKFIFGRYIDFSSETERNMFDIRLMKEGRMKGQAFIGLPNEKSAIKALKEVNGYVLQEKPMVVQFARSARPKQDLTEGKRSKQK